MKKQTKKLILVGFLALTMFFSTIAWVIFSGIPVGPQQQSGQTQVPENFVVEGYLNSDTAAQLLQRGYSIMEWHYYGGCCPDLMLFVEAMPAELEYQLLIQKIADAANETRASVRSLRGEQQWSVSSAGDLLGPLCEILLKPPVECGLMQFGNVTQ